MTKGKNELFEKELQESSLMFKTLSHPARLSILKYLSETDVCITGDICDELPLSRTTVTQHLKELKDSGLIQGQISGSRVKYCIDHEKVKKLKELFNDFIKKIDKCKKHNC